jgi:hypothetical protein
MSDESAADEMPPAARTGSRKSINKGRWSKEEVSKHTSGACWHLFPAVREG